MFVRFFFFKHRSDFMCISNIEVKETHTAHATLSAVINNNNEYSEVKRACYLLRFFSVLPFFELSIIAVGWLGYLQLAHNVAVYIYAVVPIATLLYSYFFFIHTQIQARTHTHTHLADTHEVFLFDLSMLLCFFLFFFFNTSNIFIYSTLIHACMHACAVCISHSISVRCCDAIINFKKMNRLP